MAFSGHSGPLAAYGSMANLPATGTGNALGGDQLVGPSFFYQGASVPDPRFLFNKEQAGGFMGVTPSLFDAMTLISIDGVPAQHSTTNIAAAHTVTSGTAMTLAAPSFGAVANIPVVAIGGSGNGYNGAAPTTAVLALDFGFQLATLTSGSAVASVQDGSQFTAGMPLVFAAIATTTTPWLTSVLSVAGNLVTCTTTAPFSAASGGARVGTGNIWQPNEGTYAAPTAAAPYLAKGPGLFFDPRQGISRGVVVTCNNASGVGGAIVVSGLDVYGQPMTESITITPASALTAYGLKAFKYILSVTPGFTDGPIPYAIGTSDVFGFATRSTEWENSMACWNALTMTATTGWTASTTPASGDVRGTIQTSAIGGGTGIGATASNGSHSSTAFTGIRLLMGQRVAVPDLIYGTPLNTNSLFGNVQT